MAEDFVTRYYVKGSRQLLTKTWGDRAALPYIHIGFDESTICHRSVLQVICGRCDSHLQALPLQIIADMTPEVVDPATKAAEVASSAPASLVSLLTGPRAPSCKKTSFAKLLETAPSQHLLTCLNHCLQTSLSLSFDFTLAGTPLRPACVSEERVRCLRTDDRDIYYFHNAETGLGLSSDNHFIVGLLRYHEQQDFRLPLSNADERTRKLCASGFTVHLPVKLVLERR